MNKFSSLLWGCLSIMTIASTPLHALETPKAGFLDKRVKSVLYHPEQVVRLIGHYGYATHIQFSPLEKVEHIAMGDSQAWEVAPTEHHIFLKPKAKQASTNMIVLTNKRVYHFELEAYRIKKQQLHQASVYYQIGFAYPEEAQAQQQQQVQQAKLQQALENPPITPLNWDYWAKGTAAITPIKMFDDGTFTYLTFAPQADLPALYLLDESDQENLINLHPDPQSPNTYRLPKVIHRLVLRHGKQIALVVNKAYRLETLTPTPLPPATSSVKRLLRHPL